MINQNQNGMTAKTLLFTGIIGLAAFAAGVVVGEQFPSPSRLSVIRTAISREQTTAPSSVKFSSGGSGSLTQNVVQQRTDSDPQAMLNQALGLPHGKERDRLVCSALGQLARKDPDAAIERLQSIPAGLERDRALQGTLVALAYQGPQMTTAVA